MKKCSKCGEGKPLEAFTKQKNGFTARCSECLREDQAEYRKRHPERSRATNNKSRQKNIVAICAKDREDYRLSTAHRRIGNLQLNTKHGMRNTTVYARWIDMKKRCKLITGGGYQL